MFEAEGQLRSARAGRLKLRELASEVGGALASMGRAVEEEAACRALSATDGDVRTSVPVSDLGTAFWLASAAFWGDVPTAAGAEVVGAVVCAKALIPIRAEAERIAKRDRLEVIGGSPFNVPIS